MKNSPLIFALLLSMLMSPSASYAKWTIVSENISGSSFYVDFERTRKHDGYVYFWRLSNYSKPNSFGSLSGLVYFQADCKIFRVKYLSDTYFTGPMGTGEKNGGSSEPDKDWTYPKPGSSSEQVLEAVCSQ